VSHERLLSVLGLVLVGTGACNANDPMYFSADTMQVDGTGTEAKETLQLKFRMPTAAEESQRQALTNQLGYEVPWLREDRVHLELRYTVTNNGDKEGKFSVRMDGANEFTRYDEDAVATAFAAANQDTVAFGLIQPTPQVIGPGQVYQGTLREDDFHEASLDLDAMGRFMISFGQLLINRSEVLPVPRMSSTTMVDCTLGCLPEMYSVRPALWEVTPRFTADQPMTFEFILRVRDDDQRLWEDGEPELMPNPTTYMPVVMIKP
jgi:hypothetical protein